MMLELDGVHTYYGHSHVLQGVDLRVEEGEVVGLLGRNGAGKTTTLRSILGLTPPRGGKVIFEGRQIQGLAPHRVSGLGVGYVPSGRRAFSDLTVRQNLVLAEKAGRRVPDGWDLDRVQELFPKLRELMGRRAGVLSGGESQMLKLGRALLNNPKMLLLDEPSEGLAPTVVEEMGARLKELRSEGIAMLVSEQNMSFALRLIERGYVLEKGTIRFEAAASELRDSEEIQHHLGV